MAEPTTPANACAICGRSLLIGERPNPFIAGGEEVAVCELCKPRAEDAGWMRPDEVVPRGAGAGSRRRRRRGSGDLLGGLRARVERVADGAASREAPPRDPLEGAQPEEPAAERAARRRSTRERVPSESPQAPPMRSSAGPDVAEALNAFNLSEHRRTVSGLSKSLGEPRATAIAVRTASGDTGARLTVAWELAWYQWEVGPGRRAPEIREISRGETVDQLRAADRNWNLDVSRDGTLARRPVGGPAE